ncbi:hypothetical protein EW145_g2132 [Phellinidium pouzarii]|uniref:ABM domain-containing protein n=1 Tax=Phellinidium pouzarii TaxID=167371 RepID=A0A4V3XDD2_9AGAM|nr:hypothetical protein EW145_g2132 [Phellinidium pouzarii]
MSLTPDSFTGSFIVSLTVNVKPEKIAEVEKLLHENDTYAKENEPGRLYFYKARSGNTFYCWEKYADKDKFQFHVENNTGLKAFKEKANKLLDGPMKVAFLQEI